MTIVSVGNILAHAYILTYPILAVFHSFLGGNSILSSEHLDECMSLVLVHNTSLYLSAPAEHASQLGFRTTETRLAWVIN